MRWTNTYQLPEPLVLALAGSDHKKTGKYSATQLLKSPRQSLIESRHADEIVQDVSSMMWSLFGTAVHAIIEKSGRFCFADQNPDGTFAVQNNPAEPPSHLLQELHLAIDLRVLESLVKVSMNLDFYDTQKRELSDWKVTSVYSFLAGGKEEWEQQSNIYAYGIGENGLPPPEKAYNYLILRDWQKRDYTKDQLKPKDERRGYPPIPFVRVENKLWTRSRQAEFIRERVHLFERHLADPDDSLPECSEEYTWGNRRCADYCSASPWCSQWKETKAEEEKRAKDAFLEGAGVAKKRGKRA